ncbi:MAG: replication-associated recombination protein A, partial [Bacteroidota bacterium]
ENPSFEVIPALLSRAQVYVLEPLSVEELQGLVKRALAEDILLKTKSVELSEYEALLSLSGGDARKLLNMLELVVNQLARENELVSITNEQVREIVQQNPLIYDKTGEMHYDIASAFIKSIRGSDPNAAVYWLARMIEAGENEKFIARRVLIAAAEDIGLANPNALLMAQTAFAAVQSVGFPEARIILSQAVIYLATSPKSNSAYLAINKAQALVRQTGNLSVPIPLRNAPTKLMKELDYGKDYKYSHDFPGHFVEQDYLPAEIKGKKLFTPAENPAERKILDRLKAWWQKWYGY